MPADYILMKMKEHIKLNIPLNLIKNDNITKKYIREKDKKQYLRMDFVLFNAHTASGSFFYIKNNQYSVLCSQFILIVFKINTIYF